MNWNQILKKAAEDKDVSKFLEAEENGIDITDMSNRILENCNLNVAKFLMKNFCGADDVLYAAVNRKRLDLAKVAIAHGADVNENNSEAIYTAVRLEQDDMIELLIKNGSEIECGADNNVLSDAIQYNCLDILDTIIQDYAGYYNYIDHAMFYADDFKNDAAMNKIISDILINHKDKINDAVQMASENGHLEVVKYLVEQGADITANNNNAIQVASFNGHLETVKYLVEQGADIAADDNNAIQVASGNGHLETVKYLIEKSADITDYDNDAVRLASENGHIDVVKCLMNEIKQNHPNKFSNAMNKLNPEHQAIIKKDLLQQNIQQQHYEDDAMSL